MKMKKVLAFGLAAIMAFGTIGCGGSDDNQSNVNTNAPANNDADADTGNNTDANTDADTNTDADANNDADAGASDDGALSYAGITLGESYTDVTATIKWLTHRTDLVENGVLDNYIADFNTMYPNITVEVEGITDYAEDAGRNL